MKKGSQVSLPMWLCGYLALNTIGNSPAVTLDLPTALAPRVLNALKADPRTVDLRVRAPHFYELAARTLEFFEEDEIVDILTDVRSLNQSIIFGISVLTDLVAIDVQEASSSNRRPCPQYPWRAGRWCRISRRIGRNGTAM